MSGKLDYNNAGHAKVLKAASEQLGRAADRLASISTGVTPPVVAKALEGEAELCIEKALDLVAAVQDDRS